MNDSSLLIQKSAVSFAKTGPAIYHSHHDMIRFWERVVKRADLPMRLTQGFNPRPRIIFPHALGLGIASRHEEVELELHAPIDGEELKGRLAREAGDTLEILAVVNLPPVKKSRQLVASSYRITGWSAEALAGLEQAAEDILARTEIVVERGAPGNRRSAEIREYIASLRCDGDALVLELHHTLAGSARPDEIAKLAAELTSIDYHDLVIEKPAMRLE